MVYDLPTNITNVSSLATYVNTVTDNTFWVAMLFTLLIVSIAILLSRGVPKEEAFFVTTIFGFLLSTMLITMNLVSTTIPILFIFLIGLSMVLLWFRSEASYAP